MSTRAKGYLPTGPILVLRDFAFPLLAVGATVTLPFLWIVFAFVVVGQAHFYTTYLYQYRGGRINGRYVLVALALAIFATLYFSFLGGLLPLAVLISILFSFHFAYDEFTLHDEPMTRSRMASVIGFTAAFSLLTLLFIFPNEEWLVLASGGVGLLALLARYALTRAAPTPGERYLWFTALLLFAAATLLGLPGSILAAIVLLHCANWYVGYGVRLRGVAQKERRYWIEAIGLFVVSCALFCLYMFGGVLQLGFLYDLAPYYAWAVAHIVLSVITSISPPRVKTVV